MVAALVALWTLESAWGLGSPVNPATTTVSYTASAIALSVEVLLVFKDFGYLTLGEDLPARARAERLAARKAAEWDTARRAERERRRRNTAARRAVLAFHR
ncbi:hypothetical protein [Actinotalea solisilvae]|uniref:hypothetical protein n=1 Tax=Actinotalea solisilvae TaxID=2072922 RepID=UPI0018F259F7|nr:hypothetical protein [Actinotalea solisilvae]